MEDIAECIVKKARMMPVDTGVALKCNGVIIAKVAVTGGFGLEVTSGDKKAALLFPMAEIQAAVTSFLTAAHVEGKNIHETHPSTHVPRKWFANCDVCVEL